MSENPDAQQAYDPMEAIQRDERSNPLTLEGVIRSVILKNPASHRYRSDALNTIYCTLGTGISWIDGRLGDSCPNNYMNMPPQVGGQGCWSRDFGAEESFDQMDVPEEVRKSLRERNDEVLRAAAETISEIDVRCQSCRPVGWYPLTWFACNLCVPSGAQSDFRDGARETIGLIMSSDPELGTERWMRHQETKEYANEILMALVGCDKVVREKS